MRVAVCEDEKQECQWLVSKLQESKRITSVQEFYDSASMEQAIYDGNRYDVIFMDIELEDEKSGLDIAELIYSNTPQTQIVFVTAYATYVQDIFLKKMNLGGYLVKPVQMEYLQQMIEKVWEETQRINEEKLQIKIKNTSYAIPYEDITYIESKGHQIIVHTSDGDKICYEKLEDIYAKVKHKFAQSHKSYLINMDQIYRIENTNVQLQNGMTVPVSRSKAPEFKKKYFDYIQ